MLNFIKIYEESAPWLKLTARNPVYGFFRGPKFWPFALIQGLLCGLILHGLLHWMMPAVQAQALSPDLQRGTTVRLAGNNYSVAWAQW